MKPTWQKLHREFAPSGEDEEGNPLAVECDWTEAMALGPVTLVRNVVRGDGRDYVCLAVVERPLGELVGEASGADPTEAVSESEVIRRGAAGSIFRWEDTLPAADAQRIMDGTLPNTPQARIDLIDRLLRPRDEEGNLLPSLISTEEAGVLLGEPEPQVEWSAKLNYYEPHAQHLREGGWTLSAAADVWDHVDSDDVLVGEAARALYEAGVRWSTHGYWVALGDDADFHKIGTQGTTSEALAWLKERTS